MNLLKNKKLTSSELSRRQFILSSTGTGFAALLMACGIDGKSASNVETVPANAANAAPTPKIEAAKVCNLTPSLEEGPFFIEGANIRKNIRDDSAGQKLLLRIQVVDANKNCQPVQNAVVNIWHCDAKGFYSGYPNTAPAFDGKHNGPPRDGMRPPPRDGDHNGMPPPPPREGNHQGMPPPPRDGNFKGMPPPPNGGGGMHEKPTSDKRFLRGVQLTDNNGQVEFETVYPGWYEPRAVHIHTKIFLNDREMLTSQLFFPEELNTKILTTVEPYKIRGANPNKTADDGVAGDNPPYLTISESGDTITASIIVGVKS